MKLEAVMLGSENAAVLGEFYTKIFGEPNWRQDDWWGFTVGPGNLQIGPHSEIKGMSSEPARVMFMFTTSDVKADFERIKSVGATVVAEPYQPSAEHQPGLWLATLADPDGNYFQLATPWS